MRLTGKPVRVSARTVCVCKWGQKSDEMGIISDSRGGIQVEIVSKGRIAGSLTASGYLGGTGKADLCDLYSNIFAIVPDTAKTRAPHMPPISLPN
jgi:hypothetical protein